MIAWMTKRIVVMPFALAAMAGLTLQGCETTGQSVGAGAATGAAIGGIIGHQSGHGWEGAAIGGVVGAGAGYVAHKHFENVRAKRHSETLMSQEEANTQWEQEHPGSSLPTTAYTELVRDECVVQPGTQIGRGQSVGFKLAYRTVGENAGGGSLCREDNLMFREAGKQKYEQVKDFSALCTIPARGSESHTTEFTMPQEAPSGDYRLTSSLYDPANSSANRMVYDYNFNVVGS
jgi:uncharacterized protein YcfJ